MFCGPNFSEPRLLSGVRRHCPFRQLPPSHGLLGSYSGPEVGFGEIAIDLLQARFWTSRITSALPTNRELSRRLHGYPLPKQVL